MPKLDRVTQKVFANQAGSLEVTAFGTAKDQAPVYTKDLAQIQNTNFLNGWQSAVLSDKSPWEEDMNALFFAVTTQLAYLFQQGIPEYDAGTTYYIGSLAKVTNNQGYVTVYKSLTNDNTGNAVTNDAYWRVFQSDGSLQLANYEIGLPQPTLSNTLFPNEIWLDGQTVSRTTYASLFNIYGTTYGAGDGSTTFVLPNFKDRVFWGSNTFGYIEAGLPNILGEWTATTESSQAPLNPTGAFYVISEYGDGADGTQGRFYRVGFDASRSNGVFGKSNTVQSPGIGCRVKTRWY